MSRRSKATQSSLELLLDTICNTFGGVLFLAILICVLLKMTSPLETVLPVQETAPPEVMQALELQLEELIAEIETLQSARAQQLEFASKFVKPDEQTQFEDLLELRARRDDLFTERLRTIGEIQTRRRHTAEVLDQLEALSRNLESAKDEIKHQQNDLAGAEADEIELAAMADELLRAIQAAQARTAPLPRQRQSWKPSVGLIVRFNRLYVWHLYDRLGNRQGLNTDEFVVVEERGGNVMTMPKPYAGVPLTVSDAPAQIVARLRGFDSGSVYLTVVIWGDSFGSFQTLKNTIVGLGFDYRLMPTADGQKVYDRGGSDSRVQ